MRRATTCNSKDASSVLAGSAAVGTLRVTFQAPTVDHLGVETPIGADLEMTPGSSGLWHWNSTTWICDGVNIV